MKKNLLLAGVLCIGYAYAQDKKGKVGVNMSQPSATLDVHPSAKNAKEQAKTNEGLLVPRVSKARAARMQSPETSTLIYINDTAYTGNDSRVSEVNAVGFYYFDATKRWKALTGLVGLRGPKGDTGSRVWPATVNPYDSIGQDGDMSVNATSGDVFEKTGGRWIKIGNLRGIPGGSGPIGLKGEAGSIGEKGDTGSRIWSDTSDPQNTTGNNGDMALNTSSGDTFEKVNGTWLQRGNVRGPKGDTGNRVWSVTSQPLDTYGTDGDMAVDASSGNIYEKKNNTWEKIGNLKDSRSLVGNIGINEENPIATLDIHKAPTGTVHPGVMFPRLTTEERNAYTMTPAHKGTMIYNITKNCIDWWDGTQWICIGNAVADTSSPSIPTPPDTPPGIPTTPGETQPLQAFLPDIELGNGAHWISSIYDDDYLRKRQSPTRNHLNDFLLEQPKGPASFERKAADGERTGGKIEPLLNVQGKIPTEANALVRYISTTVKKAVDIPAFKTEVNIPGQYTANGKESTVVLSWEKTNISSSQPLEIKIYAKDKEIALKQLDLVAGLGEDHMGMLMASFRYPKNQLESQQDRSSWSGNFDLYLISGIPHNFNQTGVKNGIKDPNTRDAYVYIPVMGPEGKIWLNNNLAADYANINNGSTFNPNQQAITKYDSRAYGALFQWGSNRLKQALMKWIGQRSGSPVYSDLSWREDQTYLLSDFNESCPSGWHTPSLAEFEKIPSYNTGGHYPDLPYGSFFKNNLLIPGSPTRDAENGESVLGNEGFLWARDEDTSDNYFQAHSKYLLSRTINRSNGNAIRCIKGNIEKSSITIPQGIELKDSVDWISSIYDEDYLSMSQNLIWMERYAPWEANLGSRSADGVATGGYDEPVLNIKGEIPTEDRPLEKIIPIEVTSPGTIPAFKTYAQISQKYIDDGRPLIVALRWDSFYATRDSKFLRVKIYGVKEKNERARNLFLKQLDLVAGQGVDQNGILMTRFRYPGRTNPIYVYPSGGESIPSDMALRLISGIPDKNFVTKSDATGLNSKLIHRFIYVPVLGPDGNVWLNNNLGAHYSQVDSYAFNPGQQARNAQDYLAYGSLFQWGRPADQHELRWWSSGTSNDVSVNKTRIYSNQTGQSLAYRSVDQLKYFTENCPPGWSTPNDKTFEKLMEAVKEGKDNIYNSERFFAGGLRIPFTGEHGLRYDGQTLKDVLYSVGEYSRLWSNTLGDPRETHGTFINSIVYNRSSDKRVGMPIRCIKGTQEIPAGSLPCPESTKPTCGSGEDNESYCDYGVWVKRCVQEEQPSDPGQCDKSSKPQCGWRETNNSYCKDGVWEEVCIPELKQCKSSSRPKCKYGDHDHSYCDHNTGYWVEDCRPCDPERERCPEE